MVKDRDIQIKTLDRLRKWERWRESRETVIGRLWSIFTRRVPLPETEELVSLAKYYYPMRADVALYVCDFGENYFDKKKVPLGEIDSCKY